MNLFGIGSIVEGVGKVADDLFTSDEERLKVALQEREIDARLAGGQLDINKAEAQNPSVFMAGWRPSIGWIGAIALGYQFILYPLLLWVWAILEAKTWVPAGAKAPLPLQADMLFAIVTGMLGIAGMRSYEKVKGAQTDRIGGR
jgi:hypothetical protein